MWHWQWSRSCHRRSCIYLKWYHPLCFRPLSNCYFKLQVLPGFQLFIWEGCHGHICFCGACVFISSLHAAPCQIFKNRADKPFHLSVLWLYPWFHNSVQLPWLFLLTTKIGPRIDGSMTTICTDFFLPYVLHSVKVRKLFPMVGIVVEYGHFVCPISLHPLEFLPSSTWTNGLGVWSTPRYF